MIKVEDIRKDTGWEVFVADVAEDSMGYTVGAMTALVKAAGGRITLFREDGVLTGNEKLRCYQDLLGNWVLEVVE